MKLARRLLALPIASALREKLTRSRVARQFSESFYWTVVGNATWRIFSAVSTVVVARILKPEAFGAFGLVQSTVSLFAVIAAFRLSATSTKFVAEYRHKDAPKAARILDLTHMLAFATCGAMAVILFASSPYVARHTLNRPDLVTPLAMGALLLFFLMYGNIKETAIAGFQNFRAIARLNVVRGVATLVVTVPLVYVFGLNGAVASLVVVAAIMLVLISRVVRRERAQAGFPASHSLKEAWSEAGILWQFALPGFIAGMLTVAMTWVGKVLLAQQPAGYAELGIFTAAYMWRTAVYFFPLALARAVLPILAETHGRDSRTEFRATVSMHLQAVCLTTLPIVVGAIVLAGPLSAVFGRHYEGMESVLPILMASVFLYSLNQSMVMSFDGTGRRWSNLGMHVAWALVFLGSCLKLIPAYGAVGLALANLLADGVLFLMQAWYLNAFLAVGVLRRQAGLFAYSVGLLVACYGAARYLPAKLVPVAAIFLLALSFMPAVRKLRPVRA